MWQAGERHQSGATGLRSSSFSLSPTPTGLKISPAAPASERVAASGLLRTTKPVHPGSQPAPVMRPLVMQLARYHQRLAKPPHWCLNLWRLILWYRILWRGRRWN